MRAVRHLLAQRHFAVLVCAAALLLRLLVPSGYMIDAGHGRLAIVACSGTGPASHMAMPMAHGAPADHGSPKNHDRPELPCAFAGLAAAALGAVDPVQLAALIAFVLAIALARTALPAPARPVRLRPPLRGPPAHP